MHTPSTRTRNEPRRPASAVLAALVTLAATAASGAAQSESDIHLLPIAREDGQVVVTGEPRAVTDRAGYDNQPYFTPDGRLLYTSIRDGQADAYRYDPGTGRTTRVTTTPESEYSPTPIPGADRFSVETTVSVSTRTERRDRVAPSTSRFLSSATSRYSFSNSSSN